DQLVLKVNNAHIVQEAYDYTLGRLYDPQLRDAEDFYIATYDVDSTKGRRHVDAYITLELLLGRYGADGRQPGSSQRLRTVFYKLTAVRYTNADGTVYYTEHPNTNDMSVGVGGTGDLGHENFILP